MMITNSEIRDRINLREIYRYLGYGRNIPDDDIRAVIDEVIDSLVNVIKPKNIYRIYECQIDGKEVKLGSDGGQRLVISSKNLSENLRDCKKVILMAATLGLEVDKLMQKYEIINMAKASITQSCGAACIEAYCNILQERILDAVNTDMSGGTSLYLRPRFSPGYGDVELSVQRDIFNALECTKRIGLTLTESLLMYPTKSVTAFIGLTGNPGSCHVGRCANCGKKDCEFSILEGN